MTEITVADQEDDALIREIDEELRQEQAQKLWKRYGNYVIGVAAAVVIGVAGYQGWTAYDRSQKIEATDRLIGVAGLIEGGDATTALAALDKLDANAVAQIDVLSRLRRAGVLARNGDTDGAASVYQAIAADNGAPQSFRDLATILHAVQLVDASADNADQVVTQLQTLAAGNSVWRHSAREISAIAYLASGRPDKAHELLQAIALDPQAPGGVRSRAQELLQASGQ